MILLFHSVLYPDNFITISISILYVTNEHTVSKTLFQFFTLTMSCQIINGELFICVNSWTWQDKDKRLLFTSTEAEQFSIRTQYTSYV